MKKLTTFLSLLFPALLFSQADCEKFCVRDIRMNPDKQGEAHIVIYSDNDFINHTYIDRVEDSNGALVAGYGKFFQFYGHAIEENKPYPLPTDLTTIPSDLEATVYLTFSELTENGFEPRTCALSYPCPFTDEIPLSLKIYPNPARNSIRVTYDNPYQELFRMEIYDLTGIRLGAMESNFGAITLSKQIRSKISRGLYIVKVWKSDELLATEKIVFQ